MNYFTFNICMVNLISEGMTHWECADFI